MSAVSNEARPINKLSQCLLGTLSETLKMTISSSLVDARTTYKTTL